MTNHRPLRQASVASLCAVAIATGCTAIDAPRTTPTSPGVDSEAYSLIQEPDRGLAPVLDVIKTARRQVRMSMYELAAPAATDALVAARARGVDTKVLLDAAYRGRATNLDTFHALRAAGIDVRWAPSSVLFHEKAIVADDVAAIGTGNLSSRFSATSRDDWVLDRVPVEVAAIAETFDEDFRGGDIGHAVPGVQAPHLIWSPAARPAFLKVITGARRTVSITSEEFTDAAVSRAVSAAAGRGVRCRIIVNEDAASSAAVEKVRVGGCSVHVLPLSKHGLYMHQKLILVDDQLVLGSQNLAPRSLANNRELSLHLTEGDAPELIATVRATFDRDYQHALPIGTPNDSAAGLEPGARHEN